MHSESIKLIKYIGKMKTLDITEFSGLCKISGNDFFYTTLRDATKACEHVKLTSAWQCGKEGKTMDVFAAVTNF